MVWTDGGFTKFDVATLQVVQDVKKAPPSAYELKLANAARDRGTKQTSLRNLLAKQKKPLNFTTS